MKQNDIISDHHFTHHHSTGVGRGSCGLWRVISTDLDQA